jgi:phosphate-selective porin OprO/OprP
MCATVAWGQTAPGADAEALLKRIQALEEQNKALVQRVEELERRAPEPPTPTAETSPTADAPVAAAPEEDGKTLRAHWDQGLCFETGDGQFRLKVGGRVMFDAAHIDGPNYWEIGGPAIDENDGTEFRRLRLRFSGDVYQDYIYKAEVDFAGNDVEIIDAYVGMRNVPYVGTVQVGQFSEPMGLEALTSSSDITFMERSMATQALIPYRSRGLAASRSLLGQRLTLAVGVFNGGLEQDNHWSVTGRVTGTPYYADEGRRVLHLGLAASHRNPESEYGFYAHPGAHLADRHLNSGELPADAVDLWAAEAAFVWGPFSVQGEFIRADVSFLPEARSVTFFDLDKRLRLHDRHFDGFYVQAGYFLTGEQRSYDPETGAFGRVVPRRAFDLHGGGWGAWELAARYDELSLDDFDFRSGVIGGSGRSLTAGVNWYLTPTTRLMLNYVRTDINQYAYDGAIDVVQARFQADF